MNPARRVEVLRETVKVAKFSVPPEALPELTDADIVAVECPGERVSGVQKKVTAPVRWERRVAAALWMIAAAIVATLYLAHS